MKAVKQCPKCKRPLRKDLCEGDFTSCECGQGFLFVDKKMFIPEGITKYVSILKSRGIKIPEASN